MSVQLLALEFLSPRPPLPAGEKAFTTVTVHCSILDVGVSQVCLATLVSVEDWNKNERWVYSISKKQFVLCLLLSLPWVRGTDPGELHRQTDRQIETDTQDRQAEGLFKEVQWKWAHSRAWIVLRCTTSLEPSQCYPPFLSQPPNCTHSSSPLFILTPPRQHLLPLLPPYASLIGQLLKPQGRVVARCQPRTKSRSHWSQAHKR